MFRRIRLLIGGMAALVLLCVPFTVLAASSDQGVVRSYATDSDVRQGMIVALKAADSSKVVPLTTATVTDMLGVAISPSQAPITLSGDAGTQVYVATSGQFRVLVSNQNGAVKAGDYISISALNGIGMKAEDSESTVLGRAAADMTSANVLEKNVNVNTSSGPVTVAIAAIPISINIANNPNTGHGTGNLPGFLQIVSNGIANKPVDASRVYLGLGVMFVAAFVGGGVLYSGVRGSLLSIGRNPLARKSILGALFQAIVVGLIIFVLGLISVYLLLKL